MAESGRFSGFGFFADLGGPVADAGVGEVGVVDFVEEQAEGEVEAVDRLRSVKFEGNGGVFADEFRPGAFHTLVEVVDAVAEGVCHGLVAAAE